MTVGVNRLNRFNVIKIKIYFLFNFSVDALWNYSPNGMEFQNIIIHNIHK